MKPRLVRPSQDRNHVYICLVGLVIDNLFTDCRRWFLCDWSQHTHFPERKNHSWATRKSTAVGSPSDSGFTP
uniref:Uncharacterized protein n=1 Tax=Utricularia reniformis TaxID=192314 RepID=A0A1Y0B3D0_9LAMI|nr:hypothetical protein AEK19_MT1703 [Utricularia reniformis]ART31883.1 hypothetical protein AEK19_MT1703 [Utricularia reniformis]